MIKIYLVALRLDAPITVERLEVLGNAMSNLGDWYRFNAFTWFLDTQFQSTDIQKQVRAVLSSDESVVVVKVDPTDFNGWASPEIWKWFQSKASTNVLANAMGLGAPTTIGPGLGRNALAGHRSPFGKSDDEGQ
jgi:hypothetical protein